MTVRYSHPDYRTKLPQKYTAYFQTIGHNFVCSTRRMFTPRAHLPSLTTPGKLPLQSLLAKFTNSTCSWRVKGITIVADWEIGLNTHALFHVTLPCLLCRLRTLPQLMTVGLDIWLALTNRMCMWHMWHASGSFRFPLTLTPHFPQPLASSFYLLPCLSFGPEIRRHLKLSQSWVLVAHACNPSSSGGRDQETVVWSQPGQIVQTQDPTSKNTQPKKGGVAQVVGCLLSKSEALSSNTSTVKKQTKKLSWVQQSCNQPFALRPPKQEMSVVLTHCTLGLLVAILKVN
jgi:hypothetical protein